MPPNRTSPTASDARASDWDETSEPASAEDVLGQLIRELDEGAGPGPHARASWDEEEGPAAPSTATPASTLDKDLEIHQLRTLLELERAERSRLERQLVARDPSGHDGPEASPLPATVGAAPHPLAHGKPLCVVPVAFLRRDGTTVATEAFFTVGKGEALDQLFSSLLSQWRRLGLRLQVTVGREGFVMFPVGDPHHRSMRFTSSGAIFLTLSPRELAALGKLPPLVTRRGSRPRPPRPPSG